MTTTIVIAAGGTGGHIYPGLALARALEEAEPDVRIAFVGTPRGLETRLIPEAGYPLHLLGMVPFSGWRRAVLPFALARATAQAVRMLRREQPGVVCGMGGYASIPVVLAARLSGTPSLIHESGAVAGRANKISARFTANVALAFDRARPDFPGAANVRTVGMPPNPELEGFDRDRLRPAARKEFDVDDATAMVLVNGGSQGSARLNDAAIGLAQRWRHRGDVRLVVKAGRADVEKVQRSIPAEVGAALAYLPRMDTAYAAADVALCRAGAGTVAELALTGLPAVLVPYPYAPDDHQAVNAGVLVDAGAAVMVRDHEASADRIGPLIEALLDDRAKLSSMADAARGIGRPDAADALAAWALELARG